MKRIIVIFTLICSLMGLPLLAQKTVNLAISDPNNPSGTKHYIYHRMLGGTYSAVDRKDVGTASTYSWVLPAPVALGTHQFAASAYVQDGPSILEGGMSTDVIWVNPPAIPTLTITGVAELNLGMKTVTLVAETSIPAGTKVVFGMVGGYSNTVNVDANGTSHSVSLAKLRPHTQYQYRWYASSPDGQDQTSELAFFTTK